MATPISPKQRQLTQGLTRLKKLQEGGAKVFRSTDFGRLKRQALLDAGFLRMVVKGWYIPARPGDAASDTTPWYVAMRDFLSGYCDQRFGADWHVSASYSLQLHAGTTTMPQQVVVHSPHGKNSVLNLPGGYSLLDYQAKDFPRPEQIERISGVQVLTLPAALVRVPEVFFKTFPTDGQIALGLLRDASDLNRELLAGGHSVVAGRLAGALRAVGHEEMANEVVATMQAAGYVVTESNPFDVVLPDLGKSRPPSPYVQRMQIMWRSMREDVLAHFPPEPGLPSDPASYLRAVADTYRTDAYHSLSIEGYRVTDELIQRVATGAWDPEAHAGDADAKNAMAAHGYWRAFESVKGSLQRILAGENPGAVARRDHGEWFRQLFGPSVDAGILAAADLAGYRNASVYIKNAMYVPPPTEAVREMMPAFFDLLAEEPSAGVRAVLGHLFFVFVHPYMDGNGRVSRFLMNAMLASGGYPWAIVRVERRDEYIAALEAASTRADIGPFARFVGSCVLEA